ncbi:hypothetical protein BCV71DRAFT_265729 [Rhizopus microsporus]|uniref:Uncharacterized protein n=1 Tax=Rhizopus microsporus TaxID=58291 RepID=A0A1X0RW82_RHIZD|nr:hypothetical protein BCV71DRAFT_265729 [Rhizopus microsporus]
MSKLNEHGDNQEEGSTGASRKGKRGQAKDAPEQLRGKAATRFSRRRVEGNNVFGPVCKSCGEPGHNSSRSPEYGQHSFSLKEPLQRDLGNYQRYAVSITLDFFYFEQ